MNDKHLSAELVQLEDRLRWVLRTVASTTPLHDAEAPLELATPEPEQAHRSRLLLAAVAALVVVAGAGVMLANPGRGPVVSANEGVPAEGTPAPTGYLFPDVLPGTFQTAFAGRPGGPVRATSATEVYAEGGSGSPQRAVVVLTTSERAALDTVLSFDAGSPRTVAGREARFASFGLISGVDLSEGGAGLAVLGRGMSEKELLQVAEAVRAGRTASDAVPRGFALTYKGRHPFIAAPDDDVVHLVFATPDGLREFEVALFNGSPSSPAAYTWQLQGDVREVTVRGRRGVFVDVVDPDHGRGYSRLIWSEGPLTVSIGGRRVSDDELMTMAGNLRPAARAEIDAHIEMIERAYSED